MNRGVARGGCEYRAAKLRGAFDPPGAQFPNRGCKRSPMRIRGWFHRLLPSAGAAMSGSQRFVVNSGSVPRRQGDLDASEGDAQSVVAPAFVFLFFFPKFFTPLL